MFDDGLRIDAVHVDDTLVLSVSGEIDMATSPRLRAVLDKSVVRTQRMSLDFSGVSFMDSSGVNMLVWAARASREAGGALSMTGASQQVRRVLEICGVAKLVGLDSERTDRTSSLEAAPALGAA